MQSPKDASIALDESFAVPASSALARTAAPRPVGRMTAHLSVALLLLALTPLQALAQTEETDPKKLEFKDIGKEMPMLMAPMRDGVRLATDVYLPKDKPGPFPVVFVKTPYDFNKIEGGTLEWGLEALKHGYAYVVQNERGRYYSEGDWELLGDPRKDGYDSLTWIAQQEWSDGNVATLGCSSTAEWQLALAAMDHPAHKAMIPMAAGAGIGRVGEFYEQGNYYKGGVHQTLMSVWLYGVQQDVRPRFPDGMSSEELQRLRKMYDLAARMPKVDWAEHLRKLPEIDWLPSAGANAGPGNELMQRGPDDQKWYRGGLYHDNEPFAVPAFWFNSWFDVSQGPNLALYQHARKNGVDAETRDGQYMVIAPTLHCGFFRIPEHKDLKVGELNVGRAEFPLWDLVFGYLDHYLKGEDNGFLQKTPRVQYYTMGRNKWSTAGEWPPAAATPKTFYLASGGRANSVFGDGRLSPEKPSGPPSDTFPYDPLNPVPSLGGGVCCNGNATKGGSYDQRAIEARQDVLVYTSDVLTEDVEVTGSIQPTLYVSSDAKDTDFTVKLVDVYPDGTAYNVDDTIMRARYREGYGKEVFMKPGEVYEVKPTPMSTSYQFQKGHRIRVEVASSKFPQYMRNLNTGGNNYDETEGVVAHNTIHHSAAHPSNVVLSVMPND